MTAGRPDRPYDLRLTDGRTVAWHGADGEDAVLRYVDSQRVAGREVAVVATRPGERHGLFVLGRSDRIIG